MNDVYKKDWQSLYQRFDAWWKFDNTDRPLMSIAAPKQPKRTIERLPERGNTQSERIRNNCLCPDIVDRNVRCWYEGSEFLAESFPNATLSFGPGAMSSFMGCKTNYTPSTVWYEPIADSVKKLTNLEVRYDTEWWKAAEEGFPKLVELANSDYLVTQPDIIDSMDTLSAMLGPQKLLYELIDNPDEVKKASDLLDDIYFKYFDYLANIITNDDGMMSVQAFAIIGKRVAKLQCDFAAMVSPSMFDEFVAPSIAKYCSRLDHALYHIDGEGEMCHVDTLVKIKGLDAFQWIPQALSITSYTDPKFYPMFDKIHEAEKGLYLCINQGTPDDWADETQRLINRYGTRGMYFLYPGFPDIKTAEKFIARFEK